MRAITGAVVSSEPCTLIEAYDMIKRFCSAHESTLRSSDSATYVVTLGNAIREHHIFLRRSGRSKQQQRASDLVGQGYKGLVEAERERQGGEKRSSKRKRKDDPHVDKAVASHVPSSPEITSELRRKKKEKRSNKELISVVKQEPDLLAEEDGGTEVEKKKGKHSDKELASSVKQEPGLVVEEELASEKKAKKKKNRNHVKLEEDMVVVKGQTVNDGVPEQGVADGEKKRKKKKHSEEEGGSKGIKEENVTNDSDLNSEKKKKKKKRGRGDDDDSVQEQGEQKKKRRKES